MAIEASQSDRLRLAVGLMLALMTLDAPEALGRRHLGRLFRQIDPMKL
jgi:hypothetical protein